MAAGKRHGRIASRFLATPGCATRR
ncbi:MAG: gallidermin family lantibiotic [Sphingosinicella sp.]